MPAVFLFRQQRDRQRQLTVFIQDIGQRRGSGHGTAVLTRQKQIAEHKGPAHVSFPVDGGLIRNRDQVIRVFQICSLLQYQQLCPVQVVPLGLAERQREDCLLCLPVVLDIGKQT